MSNVWTRLEVASAHTPDAVCLAFVCVRLGSFACICEPSTVRSNFQQYFIKCKLSTRDEDHHTAKTSQ